MNAEPSIPVHSPPAPAAERFEDAAAAVERLKALYSISVDFLIDHFNRTVEGNRPEAHFRAFYIYVRVST